MRILFPSVYRGRYIAPLFSMVGSRSILVAAAFFSLYWILPLIASAIPVMCRDLPTMSYAGCAQERFSIYVSDLIHFSFALVASLIVFFAYTFVLDFHVHISRLAMARSERSSRQVLLQEYQRAVAVPFGWISISICITVAGLTALLFWDRIFDSDYSYWWGNLHNGIGGLTYTVVASIFTYFAVKYFILLVASSVFLIYYARRHMMILPFDPDGMSGLSSAGIVIVRIWRQTALLAICLFIVFSSNYLDISSHWVVWILATLVVSSLPFAALVPFAFLGAVAARQKKSFRTRVLRSLSVPNHSRSDFEKIALFFDVAGALEKVVVLPVRGWRFLIILAFNGVQLYVSADAILKGLPN